MNIIYVNLLCKSFINTLILNALINYLNVELFVIKQLIGFPFLDWALTYLFK